MIFFLDTNICIYFLKGMYPKIRENLQSKNPEFIKIPSIVKAELLYGAEKSNNRLSNIEKVQTFLEPFDIIPFDDESSIAYSRIRSSLEQKGNTIGPNDYIIASIALAYNGTLITNNEKEFKKIKNLNVENWTKKTSVCSSHFP